MINNIKTVGIVGGGQLGRMMIPYIKKLGLKAVVLDPAEDCPCAKLCDTHIVAGFSDPKGFARLAELCDVITYEFEHIDTALLKALEDKGQTIYPSVESLKVIQDKYTQNEALRTAGIAVPDFFAVTDLDDLKARYTKLQKPLMLKSRKGGYDGKGNAVIKTADDIETAYNTLSRGGTDDLMAEPLLNFKKEVSVIATRGQDGTCVIYPIAENLHKNSILDVTTVPAAVDKKTAYKVDACAKAVMECFKGIGTFCAELFVTHNGDVLVNEVAPRVHNSGHFSIEACATSQFENHVRAIVGLKPGSAELKYKSACMKNIIGTRDGAARYTGLEDALAFDHVHVHIYGKSEVKPGRKMGHVTLVGDPHEIEKKLQKLQIKA